jgi:predicted ester cyclase
MRLIGMGQTGDRREREVADAASTTRRWNAVGMSGRSAREVVEELFRRQQARDGLVLDDLVAEDMVNHAAGLQGRSGLARILSTIEHDLGPVSAEQHHLVGDGDIVAQHVTVHGIHRASTMPLLADVSPSGRPVAWTFIHIWRVADGMIVEHWACRDDMGLLDQLRD